MSMEFREEVQVIEIEIEIRMLPTHGWYLKLRDKIFQEGSVDIKEESQE